MPRSKSKSVQTSFAPSSTQSSRRIQKNDEWGGFVQVTVDEAHRADFDLWLSETGQAVYRELDDSLGSGLKFTLAFDGAHQCYIASLTGRPDVTGERAFTCCLSARGGTFEEAIALLIYKHASLLHYDWWDAVNEPKRSRYSFG